MTTSRYGFWGWALGAGLGMWAAGCARSHPPADGRASVEDSGLGAGEDGPVAPGSEGACGYADPAAPAVLGYRGPQVWLQAADGSERLLHDFDADDDAAPGSAALQAGGQIEMWQGGSFLLLQLQDSMRSDARALSRALYTRDGERRWSRSEVGVDAGEVRSLSPRGEVIVQDAAGHLLIQPDGREQRIAERFTPFDSPTQAGWIGGMFDDREGRPAHYGFAHGLSGETRRLGERLPEGTGRTMQPSGVLPHLVEGRFYYGVLRADGMAQLVSEGPDELSLYDLDVQERLPYLEYGSDHVLVLDGDVPRAVFDRSSQKLLWLEGPAPEEVPLVQVVAEGEYFVGHGLDARGTSVRRYRVHAPSARLDTDPVPALPEGMKHFEYNGCYRALASGSADGHMLAALAPSDAGDEGAAQIYVEDGQQWTPLGAPVIYGVEMTGQRLGESWWLQSLDVRNRYCPAPPHGDPGARPPGVLLGYSQQLQAADGTLLTYEAKRDEPATGAGLSPSPDGSCVILLGDANHMLRDLHDHGERPLDLERPTWLTP